MNRRSEDVLEETTLPEQNDICRPSVPKPTVADFPVDVPDVENVTVGEKDNVHHLALTDRAIKLHTAEQVMAEVTTRLCNLEGAMYQQLLQSFKLLGELMSAETEVNLYCKTRHSAEPLPLNNTSDLLRLQGKSPQTLVPRVKTQDGVLLPSSSKNNAMENGGDNTGLCILKPDDEVWPKNPEPVSKRKAPLVQRVTDIPASTAPAGIRFLRLKNATSTKDRGGTHSKRRVATHSAALQNGVCRACSQADDPMQQCAAVSWVLCDVCGSWFHQSCAGFQGKEPFTCAFCNT
ncbi:unnamed protein product [Dicrocoelium dendriticum]|nr:unnamed protein product [Dicrocoelium dendriticum]